MRKVCKKRTLLVKRNSLWNEQDSSVLVNTMIAQFVELDAIWQSVKDDTAGGVADDYKEGIQQNQTLILVGLKRLMGSEEAMRMIKNAVKEARKAKSQKRRAKATTDARPRNTTNASTLQQAASRPPLSYGTHRGPRWGHQATALGTESISSLGLTRRLR